MQNKLTLIIDGNWLLMSRMSVMINKFADNLSIAELEAAQIELYNRMYKSIILILNKFKDIDNIILIQDGGSWRKNIKRPPNVSIYKGQRIINKNKIKVNWTYIFGALKLLKNKFDTLNLTTSYAYNIEGDDWAMYWAQYLNNNGINVIIWTSDQDLQQLVTYKNNIFTCWYNNKSGFVFDEKIQKNNLLDVFLNLEYNIYDKLIENEKVTYIIPNTTIKRKILCGDKSDNIDSAIKYTYKNKQYGIGLCIANKIININANTLNEFINISWQYLNTLKKYKGRSTFENFKIHMEYNAKLVWLIPQMYPQNILFEMSKSKYLIPNASVHNYFNEIENKTIENLLVDL